MHVEMEMKNLNQSSRSVGGSLVSSSPQKKLQAPKIEVWNIMNQWDFCQIRMSSPPART